MKKLTLVPADPSIDILARTIYGEARGEGSAGMQAVAAVIMNRVRIAQAAGYYWWGGDIESVCRKPFQFSCWNAGDPNRALIDMVKDSDIVFATALRIARRAAAGTINDPTNGATHYHATGITPDWAKNQKPCAVIGQHIFYRI